MKPPEFSFMGQLPPLTQRLFLQYISEERFGHAERLLTQHPPHILAELRTWLASPDCFLDHLQPAVRRIAQTHLRDRHYLVLKNLFSSNPAASREYEHWATRNNINLNALRPAQSEINIADPPPAYSQIDKYPKAECENKRENPLSASLQSLSIKRSPQRAFPVRPMARRCFFIPGNLIGLMVGTKGSNIAPVEQKYQVKIHYPRTRTTATTQITIDGPSEEYVLAACLEILDRVTMNQIFKNIISDYVIVPEVRKWDDQRIFDFFTSEKVFVKRLSAVNIELRAFDNDSLIEGRAVLDDHCGGKQKQPEQQQQQQPVKPKNRKWKPKNLKKVIRPIQQVAAPPQIQTTCTKLKDETTILLLGVSGVGKSTFLNAVANYFAFGDDYQRAEKGITVTIEAAFNKYDDNGKIYKIDLVPKDNSDAGNENKKVGESATQEPRCYSFKFLSRGKEKIIRIIDTPGLVDTNGVIQDKKNMENILFYLKNFQTIQAVCILMKPSEPKLNPPFRYYLNELLSHLHKDAAKNVLFCFPHTCGSDFNPGDTRAPLEKLLTEIEKKHGVKITLEKNNIFCFDNDGFRYFAARKFGGLPPTKKMKNPVENWTISANEIKRMLEVIATLPDYEIGKTLAIKNARNTLMALAGPMAEMTRKIFANKRTIDYKLQEIKRLKDEGADLQNSLHYQNQKYDKVPVAKPRIVCMTCATPIGQNVTLPRICHNDCECNPDSDPFGAGGHVKRCSIFHDNTGEICRICGCPWNAHERIKYDVVVHSDTEINVVVGEGVDRKAQQLLAAEEFIGKLSDENNQLDGTLKMLKEHSAVFITFVKHHSFVACNDAFCDYVEQFIQDEQNREERDKLTKFKQEYEEELKLYEDTETEATAAVISIESVKEKLDELLNDKEIGNYLSNLKEFLETSSDGSLPGERVQQLGALFGK